MHDATPPRLRAFSTLLLLALVAPVVACDDDSDDAETAGDDFDSGFMPGNSTSGATSGTTGASTSDTSDTSDTGTTDLGSTTSSTTTGDPEDDDDADTSGGTTDRSDDETQGEPGESSTASDDESGGPVLGEGDLRGILTFARYGSDPLNDNDVVGFAGAWRTAERELVEVEDFFGVWGLDTPFPIPPAEPDTLEHNGLLGGFDWGLPVYWRLAGNAMALVHADTRAQACLLYRGGAPEVEFAGMTVPNYPIYASTNSSLQPAGCQPDAAQWIGDTAYDLVLYGGALFPTNVLRSRVHTPPTFEVAAPDFARFQARLSSEDDLTVRWTANGNPGNRVVLRARDMFGRMFTVHAADDGEYTIRAADLQELDPGPLTLMVARENLQYVPFTDGTVKVLTRYEQWGYFELD